MIICETFEQAFLALVQLIATGDTKDATLIFFKNQKEWGVVGDDFDFDDEDPNYTYILEMLETLFKYEKIGRIKEINLSYSDNGYTYNIAMNV